MKKRVVIVPKNKEAEIALDFDKATKNQLIEFSIKERDFLFMYEKGIIELINKEGKSNIDDFEDDSVKGKENLYRVIKAFHEKNILQNNTLIKKLSFLFKEAFDRDTGVYFYF